MLILNGLGGLEIGRVKLENGEGAGWLKQHWSAGRSGENLIR